MSLTSALRAIAKKAAAAGKPAPVRNIDLVGEVGEDVPLLANKVEPVNSVEALIAKLPSQASKEVSKDDSEDAIAGLFKTGPEGVALLDKEADEVEAALLEALEGTDFPGTQKNNAIMANAIENFDAGLKADGTPKDTKPLLDLLEPEEVKVSPYKPHEKTEAGLLTEVEGAILNLVEKFTFKQREVIEHVGLDWAHTIDVMEQAEMISGPLVQRGIDAIIKKAKGVHLTNDEADDFDTITDMIEAAEEKLDIIKMGSAGDIHKVTVDQMTITPDNQNAPFDMERMSQISRHHPDQRWVEKLDEGDLQALTVMTHIRGGNFPKIRTKIDERYEKERIREVQQFASRRMYPSKEDYDKLSELDVASLNFYSMRGDGPMNAALRQGKVVEDSQLLSAIDATQSALDKLPGHNELTYRYINDHALQVEYRNMEIGEEYGELAFMSTSRNELVDLATMTVKEGKNVSSVNMVIKPLSDGRSRGKAMEQTSEFISEAEIIFKHSTRFRVVAKADAKGPFGDNALVIFVEEVE